MLESIMDWVSRNWHWILIVIFMVVLFVKRLSNRENTDDEGGTELTEPDAVPFEKSTIYPVCSHCEKEMKELLVIFGDENTGYIIKLAMCPHCRKPVCGNVEY